MRRRYFNFAAETVAQLVNSLNSDLALFTKWCNNNKLTIYVKKSTVLPYYSARQDNYLKDQCIIINGHVLECVTAYNYLGIRIDCNLRMHAHLTHFYRSTVNMLYSLCKLRKFMDKKTAIILFKAHILSRLEYGSLLRIGSNGTYLDKLQRLMNISLSCLNKNYDDSVHKIHIEAKVLPLDMRRNIALLKSMFNSINKVEMNENLMLDNTYVKTRSSSQKNFRITRPRYEWYRKAVVY